MAERDPRYFEDYIKTMVEAVNQDGRPVMRATAINFLLVRPDRAS